MSNLWNKMWALGKDLALLCSYGQSLSASCNILRLLEPFVLVAELCFSNPSNLCWWNMYRLFRCHAHIRDVRWLRPFKRCQFERRSCFHQVLVFLDEEAGTYSDTWEPTNSEIVIEYEPLSNLFNYLDVQWWNRQRNVGFGTVNNKRS